MQAIAQRAAAPIFAITLFTSAALIFVLQPLFGRMVTPMLGGSPAVWNVSMAFFQAALLLGYLYAHLLARLRDLRLQALIHIVVLGAAWFALPVHVSAAFGPPNSVHPALWLLGVLALSVGAPFAAISATAPLLQSWYARTGRADAHDPYYLYAASNLGSFAGLLAYPVLIEPLFGVHAQSVEWASGYVLAAALILAAGALTITANGAVASTETTHSSPAPTTNQRLYWIAAAAAPSALILGVTLHITTDVASAPFLWVVPLALYLATFVVAFSKRADAVAPYVQILQPIGLALLVAFYLARTNWPAMLSGNLIGFFLSALVCHLALARSRPSADRLTEFYFFVSLGGVLGGAFAAFVAPVIFNDVYEYPLALAAACLFLPRGAIWQPRLTDIATVAPVFMALIVILSRYIDIRDVLIVAGALGAAGCLIATGWGEENTIPPYRYGFLIAAAVLAIAIIYCALNLDHVLERYTDHGDTKIRMLFPWNWVVGIASGFALLFATHASAQPRQTSPWFADVALGVAIPAMSLMLLLPMFLERLNADTVATIGIAFCALALIFNRTRPLVLACLVLVSFTLILTNDAGSERTIRQVRTFFGVLRTREMDVPTTPTPLKLRILLHGTTLHGAQIQGTSEVSRLPLTYYNPNTALGEAILAGLAAHDTSNIALIGLGAGSTACLTRPTDHLTIFEIDPEVVHLSDSATGDFTYVPQCQPHAQVRLGDARLQIANEPDGEYNVIVVDAFSSDAIPAHLLTREAVALYLRKATDDGVVILHLSNRNLALVGESSRVAHALGVPTLFLASAGVNNTVVPFYGGTAAMAMIIAKNPVTLAHLRLSSNNWRVMAAPPGRAWEDDYINLARALWEDLDGQERCRIYPYDTRCPNSDAALHPR